MYQMYILETKATGNFFWYVKYGNEGKKKKECSIIHTKFAT